MAQTLDSPISENELRRRLEEAEDTIRALRSGEADALLVASDREQVFTLESADKPYWLMVGQMPDPAAILTADGVVLSCNQGFANLVGREPVRALAGESMLSFVADHVRPDVEALLRSGLARDTQGDVPLSRPDGAPLTAHFGIRSLREGAFGFCLLVVDLTTQQHYQELKRTQAALRDADRRKDEFMATLAHELRQPLAPMRNAVEILKTCATNADDLEWARGVLDRQVRLMTRLLEDLLDISRLSRQGVELRLEPVELGAVIEAAVETSRPFIDDAGLKLTQSLPGPVRLTADPVRLAQVLTNILNNAARYTEAGGSIHLRAEREDGGVAVSVRDTGVGIDPEMLPSIFEIYSQANPAFTRSRGGLGIGLSLARGLVELHGGTIEAKSEGRGRGSEFIVRLPIAS